ncbi:MAG: hypothetical protein HFI16_12900 [Lachnospiraceae bacterium]|nr:hypothetical protein [Lachnospiraceae bacterium]
MKEKYLVIEEFELQRREEVTCLLERVLKEEYLRLTIKWRFCKIRLRHQLIEEIAAMIYQQGTGKEFSVCCIVETGQWREVYRLRRFLNRYGFEVVLLSSPSLTEKTVRKAGRKMLLEEIRMSGTDYKSLRKEYERLKSAGIPLSFDESNISSEEYAEWFRNWASDQKACWLLPFREITGYLMTGIWMGKCEHSSCLGKYLCLDQDGMLWFCGKKREGSRMHRLSGRSEELFDENYNRILERAVEGRRHCQAECGSFSVCRGGCPLKSSSEEDCRNYQKKIAYIRSFLTKHSRNYFADIENPVIRQMFLSTVAFGFIPEEHGA